MNGNARSMPLYATITVYGRDKRLIGTVKCYGPAELLEQEQTLVQSAHVGALHIRLSALAVDHRIRSAFAMLRRLGYLE